MQIQAGDFQLDYHNRTLLMGIVNLTPDSFSKDGLLKNRSIGSHDKTIQRMIEQGADIIDIGAESSRPNASQISSRVEINRITPTLKKISGKLKVPLSLDSYKTDVIHAGLDLGVSIVNNIHGTKLTKSLLKIVRTYKAAIVLMHMRGSAKSMHKKTYYKDLIKDVTGELKVALNYCLDFGINKESIIIDPGIGFAKLPQDNNRLLYHLHAFSKLGMPVLVGTSRKSFLGVSLKDMNKDRTAATAASVSVSILNGANIVRVHDVAFMKDVVTVTDSLKYI